MRDLQNDLGDIPDYDGMEDEGFPAFPPPHSPGQGGQEDGGPSADGADGELSRLAEVPVAKRKGVKRPQPKLDSQRLTSERGLPALRTLFDNVRFKGKGHEAEDLKLLMQKMENWAHRLYPKLQFEDFINKVEKLGAKKDVQTCLKRIRLDMPLTHEDFIDGDGEGEAPPELQVFGDPDPFSRESFVHSTPAPPAAPPASLSEEQLRRMELNRQRALERRLARQQQTGPSDSQPGEASSLENEPTSVSLSDVLNSSRDQDEKVEDLNQESVSNNGTQEEEQDPPPPSQPPPKDSEPSAEDEKETHPDPEHQPNISCEDGE